MNLLKEWADKLNGRKRWDELTEKEEKELRNQGLVVVFGASDDLCEFRGAIYDEADCYGGGIIILNQNGLIEDYEYDDMSEQEKMRCSKIKSIWCGDSGFAWSYETEIPHETFAIMDDDESYCQGIIFDIADLEVQG